LAGCLTSAACKVLAETLRSLERDDLASSRPVTGAPERTVEYKLSELGLSPLPVIDHPPRWGRAHLSELDRHRHDHDQASETAKPAPGAATANFQPSADPCWDR
jgi:DNA-binding HxlR family transcriptional regulator